jgi:endonuclease YncB( thermonuclease family)
MKPLILSILLLSAFTTSVKPQSPETQKPSVTTLSFEYENECGSPVVESMAWSSIDGRVTKGIGGATILVLTADHKRKRVTLAAVDASADRKVARALLVNLVLNHSVSVLVNPSNAESSNVAGVVHTRTKEINRELIEAGVARYREPAPYVMSNYTACVYRILEKKAREAKRGTWQRGSL